MKGTIDVQIKNKDGSIETRHEKNVVFDLPALHIKAALEMPTWAHMLCGNSMNPGLEARKKYLAEREKEKEILRKEEEERIEAAKKEEKKKAERERQENELANQKK